MSFLIKKIIEEQTENGESKTSEISLIQTELDNEGIKIDAEKIWQIVKTHFVLVLKQEIQKKMEYFKNI